jgi:hypothetical protein
MRPALVPNHLSATIGAEPSIQHCEGDGIMTYDADLNIDLLDHLLSKQRRRQSSNQQMLPAIEMVIGDWYTDELGVLTREVMARD